MCQRNALFCPHPLFFNLFCQRMFLVVEFLGEKKSVAVLPQSWYKDGAAYWPDYKNDDKINKAARSAEKPGKHWTRHDARVLTRCG